MAMRISVLASKELQATILLLKGSDREIAKQTRAAIKTVTQSEWQGVVRQHTQTRLENRVLADTARVAITDQNGTLKVASVGRALSKGGAKPAQLYAAVEFGANQATTTTYSAHRGATRYVVHNRHTTHQLRPRNSRGYGFYPAAAEFIPRAAALYVQTAVRTIYEAFEKGGLR